MESTDNLDFMHDQRLLGGILDINKYDQLILIDQIFTSQKL